jgi:4-hydroxybenzoate polyprenyltransferase
MSKDSGVNLKVTSQGEPVRKPTWFSFRRPQADLMIRPAGRGFVSRMRVYLAEMYPIPRLLGTWALIYFGFTTILARINGVQLHLFSWNAAAGIATLLLFGLNLRLMDELKDRDIDQELFRDRPFPAGRVLESDIKFSLGATIALILIVNAWMGKALLMALVLLGYSFLMFRFFFIPAILRRYLLLALATHNPVVALTLLYVVVVFTVGHGLPLAGIHWPQTLLLLLMFWSMLFAWEVARKIRSPEEENAYVTYSRILGRSGAVLLAGGSQTISFGIGLYFTISLPLSPLFLAVLMIGYGRTFWAYLRFLVDPSPLTSKLKPYAEQYTLATALAGLLDYLVRWGEGVG